MNRTALSGHLTRDPELRRLPSGLASVRLSVAHNERWRDRASGEIREKAHFFECEAFGKAAETLAKHFVKGRWILVEGRLNHHEWKDRESGENRSRTSVVIEHFESGPAAAPPAASTAEDPAPAPAPACGEDVPC